jgi:hypothetical protein
MTITTKLTHTILTVLMLSVPIGYILCLTIAPRIDHHQQLTSYDFKETFYLNIKPWNSLTPSLNLCIQSIKITHLCRSAKPSKLFLLLTLILAIDIHNNPGPIRFPCGICQKPVATNHRSIQCDECNFWVHIKCGGITPKTYENFMNKNNLSWECPSCSSNNLPDTSKPIADDLDQQNSFSMRPNSFETDITDKLETFNESQDIEDSPSRRRNNNNIRLMTVNCRSLRSQQQENELTTLIDTYEPHIIHATETHLDKTISIVEIIDTNIYEVCRKDRVFKPGITLDTDCEILWNKIELKSRKPLYTGCYYRQPDNNIDAVESLITSLTRLTHSNNLPNIILSGDFNMPYIKWKRDDSNNFQIKTNNNYNMEINNKFVEALEENCLNQAVTEPTRQHNILELVLTTNPSIIENIFVEDGMSDHKIVITDINIKPKQR